MASPPRPLRGSPPRRAALHRLSDSHANEQATPTLRMVGHPEASVYDTNPYPTKPSQVLPPGGQLPPQGSPFRNTMQEAVPTTGQQNFPREPSNEKHSQTRGYDSRQGSDAGPNNGQSSDVSSITLPPPSPARQSWTRTRVSSQITLQNWTRVQVSTPQSVIPMRRVGPPTKSYNFPACHIMPKAQALPFTHLPPLPSRANLRATSPCLKIRTLHCRRQIQLGQ